MLDFFLSSIPSWLWILGSGAGLAAFFLSGILSNFPPLKPYALFVKPVAGILTLFCVFMYGGSGVQAMWEEKVRVAQEEADKKASEARELNLKLELERNKKQQVRVEYRDRVKTEIREVEKQINAKCEIDPIVNEKLNKAAKNPQGASK